MLLFYSGDATCAAAAKDAGKGREGKWPDSASTISFAVEIYILAPNNCLTSVKRPLCSASATLHQQATLYWHNQNRWRQVVK